MAELDEYRALKSELLKSKLRSEVSQSDYLENNAAFTKRISAIEGELKDIESNDAKLESFIRFAELSLMDIGTAWQVASPEQRQKVQNLLFHHGLTYSMTKGFLNHSKSCLFNVLESLSNENLLLASPTGFEPVLSP